MQHCLASQDGYMVSCRPHSHSQGHCQVLYNVVLGGCDVKACKPSKAVQEDKAKMGRHHVFDCPDFQGLRQQRTCRDFDAAMLSFMWHQDQKFVCGLVLAIVNEDQTSTP